MPVACPDVFMVNTADMDVVLRKRGLSWNQNVFIIYNVFEKDCYDTEDFDYEEILGKLTWLVRTEPWLKLSIKDAFEIMYEASHMLNPMK